MLMSALSRVDTWGVPSEPPTPPLRQFYLRGRTSWFSVPCRVSVAPGFVEVVSRGIFSLGLRIGVRQQRNPLIFLLWSPLPLGIRRPKIEVIDDDSGDKIYLEPFFQDYRRITSALAEAGFLIRERKGRIKRF
jgi:hypothetical protein